MSPLPELLSNRLGDALAKVCGDRLPAGFVAPVTAAADTRFGDYQSNAAMVLAKQVGTNPRELAAAAVEGLELGELCEPAEIAGPGFINFRVRPGHLAGRLSEMLGDERLGVPAATSPLKLLVDFSSPNVAKPMHIGHIRSTVIGDCIARVARFLGHGVVADNHIGDWGTPIGQVLYGWKNHLDREAFEAAPTAELLRLYQKVKAEFESDPEVEKACLEETVKLQSGDTENRALWEQFIEITGRAGGETYRRLDVHFDTTLGESFYDDRLAPLVEKLLADGIAEESDGAVCVFSDGELDPKDDPLLVQRDGEWRGVPCLIRKRDGGFTYATTDIATVDYRVEEERADQVLYVVDDRQSLHFRQIFEVARQRGIAADLRHVAFGKILGDDRKPFKTRSGEVPSLDSVLDEAVERARAVVDDKSSALSEEERAEVAERIGIGAVKYAELSQNRASDYIFSWDKMLSLQGNTAPYLINAYVRTRAIFRKLDGAQPDFGGGLELAEDAERTLAIKLCQYAETVPAVLVDHRPNLLATYLYELAQTFHSFYERCPVLSSEGVTRDTRLALCELCSRVLKHGLGLLGIAPPERM